MVVSELNDFSGLQTSRKYCTRPKNEFMLYPDHELAPMSNYLVATFSDVPAAGGSVISLESTYVCSEILLLLILFTAVCSLD